MLAMVLLTFWGERKASLCFTDFFIASKHQIFLMLAMVLLTFWGARKASLRLTDFFTGVQQQIFLVLAMVLLILLGDKKSLLGLDRFLHRGTAANLPHACHVSSNFLGWRNASLLLTDSLPAEKGGTQGVFSCQRKNFLPTLWFLLSFLKKQKCLTLPQGFPPEDYPQASNMLAFYVCWAKARMTKYQGNAC